MLRRELPWLQYEFFPATDGKVDVIPDDEVSQSWNTKRNALYGTYEDVFDNDGTTQLHSAKDFEDPGVVYKLSPGERGCAHSHRRMWVRAAQAEGPTLILEDDVEVVFERTGGGMSSGTTFTTRLELAMREAEGVQMDVLYLGWAGFRDGNFKHHECTGSTNTVVRKAEYVWTTVAYVIWPAGAKKLLERAAPMDQPVDNFMAWEAREGRLASYVALDEGDTDDTYAGGIVDQVDFTGDSDIKKSDGGHQDDDPTEHLTERAQDAAAAGA